MSQSTSAFEPISRFAWIVTLLVAGGSPALSPLLAAQSSDRPGSSPPFLDRIPDVAADTAMGPPGWVRPLASAVVPGSGQFLAGAPRGAIYLVVEAFLITKYVNSRSEAHREQDQYLDLAFEVARDAFTPSIRDTAFGYFEQMTKFVDSGPFDADPGPGFAPPVDEESFNGNVWKLARQTFFEDPESPPDPSSAEYQRAVQFYQGRAVGPNFTWSWRNTRLEHDEFRQAIRRSDDAFQRSTGQLGLVLANHLLSAMDAFISERLSAGGRRAQLRTVFTQRAEALGGATLSWRVIVAF